MADDDDLLERARDLGRRAEAVGEASGEERQRPGALGKVGRTLRTIGDILGPIGRFLAWLFGLLRRWFSWAAFEPGENGRFSWPRLFRNLALSALVPLLLHVMLSAMYFYGTYFDETVYVTGKQEIETGELYQFGGCTSLPCSTESDNGKFYLIESSLYFPQMFYPEENVFANIPQQDAACHVEGYGLYFRSLRWIYKSLQFYQHVVDVSCRPYTEEEIRRAVDEGTIVKDTPTTE